MPVQQVAVAGCDPSGIRRDLEAMTLKQTDATVRGPSRYTA
jgi:hypothetical protein